MYGCELIFAILFFIYFIIYSSTSISVFSSSFMNLKFNCMFYDVLDSTCVCFALLPCNYQLSKSIIHEIKFSDIAVM